MSVVLNGWDWEEPEDSADTGWRYNNGAGTPVVHIRKSAITSGYYWIRRAGMYPRESEATFANAREAKRDYEMVVLGHA